MGKTNSSIQSVIYSGTQLTGSGDFYVCVLPEITSTSKRYFTLTDASLTLTNVMSYDYPSALYLYSKEMTGLLVNVGDG